MGQNFGLWKALAIIGDIFYPGCKLVYMGQNMKVSAAIFRNGNKILLMRRSPGQAFSGEWEYPGGKFEDGEDGPTCMHRELFEELGIDATVGRLLAIVHHTMETGRIMELHAYEISDFNGDFCMTVHDDMHWVPLSELLLHPQLPADLLISRILCNTQL